MSWLVSLLAPILDSGPWSRVKSLTGGSFPPGLHPLAGQLAYINDVDAQSVEMPLLDDPGMSPASQTSLERARDGDLMAFRELLRKHKARVFSIALRFTGRRADAEELAQDVFLQLHGALRQIESEAHLKHWLLRTVSHRCIDRLRQGSRQPQLVPIESLAEGMEPAAADAGHDPLAGAHIRRLLRELTPDARAVMLLKFQEDLDPTEIASVLAISVNTVKSHLRRSLDWLRGQLAGEEHGS